MLIQCTFCTRAIEPCFLLIWHSGGHVGLMMDSSFSTHDAWGLSFSHWSSLVSLSLSLFDSEQMIASQLTPHYWSISLGRRGRQSLPLMTSTGTRTERVLTLTVLTTWQNGWFTEQFSFCLFYCPFFLFSDLWITSRQRCWKLSSWLTLKVWRLSVKKTLPKSCCDSQTWKTLVPIWKMSASVYLMKRYSIHVRTVIYWTIHWSVMK